MQEGEFEGQLELVKGAGRSQAAKRATSDRSSPDRLVVHLARITSGHVPSVRRAFPPVGWQRTVEQEPQRTTVWACEKTVVMLKHPVKPHARQRCSAKHSRDMRSTHRGT